MLYRFQTRLMLYVGLLIAVAIGVMTVLLVILGSATHASHYFERGYLITRLVNSNVEYGASLPPKVMDAVGGQMLVSALLTAEFVAVAEQDAGYSPEQITARLQRVIDRSVQHNGFPLVDEFWITDETGRAYIHTEDFEFQFSPDSEEMPQASQFWPLLEPDAPPVVQDLQPREADGALFKYVGVPGVDRPRIVQLGVGERMLSWLHADFRLENVLEQFLQGTDVERIVVVDADGNVVASASAPGRTEPAVDTEVLAFCREFLSARATLPSEYPALIRDFGRHIGVVTPIQADGAAPGALFVEHQTERGTQMVREGIRYTVWVGLGMLGLALVVSNVLSRRVSKPILQLEEGVRTFGQGDFSQRVRISKPTAEFHALAESFNQMAASLQHHVAELRFETQRRERLESELRIAAELQQALLPKAPPDVFRLDVASWSRPARQVGGDFFDYVPMGPSRLGLVIGDATDKGLPAALHISECWSVLQALVEECDSPAELLCRVNHTLFRRYGTTGRFVTLFFLVIDTEAGRAQYSVAGHNPPLLLGANGEGVEKLRSRIGMPLGIFDDAAYEDIELELKPRDTIVLYSDGLTEAHGHNHALYGETRLCSKLREVLPMELSEVIAAVREDVEQFIGESEPHDDLTIVGARLLG